MTAIQHLSVIEAEELGKTHRTNLTRHRLAEAFQAADMLLSGCSFPCPYRPQKQDRAAVWSGE